MSLFEEELIQVFKVAKTEEDLNNFFDHIEVAGLFTKPSFLYVLKCQIAANPEVENEIRKSWRIFRQEESE